MITYEDFKKLDLRTAKILEVIEHPNADKLYMLTIDVGGVTKKIVAGVRAFYTKEELIGKTIVVVNNLEPATIRGEVSEGMCLAASNETMLTVLVPDKTIASGSIVK